MPSPVAHTLGGYAFLIAIKPDLIANRQTHLAAIGAAMLFTSMPDWDFLVAQFTHDRVWGHHYFSHSIPFAFLIGLLCYALLKIDAIRKRVPVKAAPWKMAMVLAGLYGTHLLLDLFTEDGSVPYGIPLFWPFWHHHFPPPVALFLSMDRSNVKAFLGTRSYLAVAGEFVVMAPIAALLDFRARRINRGER